MGREDHAIEADAHASVRAHDRGDEADPAILVEARLGFTVAPVIVTDGAGDQTVLLGANGSLRARIPLAASVHWILAVGSDLFATRTVYRIDAKPALTTPQLAPWIAAGLEVAL